MMLVAQNLLSYSIPLCTFALWDLQNLFAFNFVSILFPSLWPFWTRNLLKLVQFLDIFQISQFHIINGLLFSIGFIQFALFNTFPVVDGVWIFNASPHYPNGLFIRKIIIAELLTAACLPSNEGFFFHFAFWVSPIAFMKPVVSLNDTIFCFPWLSVSLQIFVIGYNQKPS